METLKLLVICLFFTFVGWKDVHAKQMPILVMPTLNENSSNDLTEKILPKSIDSSESSQSVVTRIIDNSLSYLWENSGMKNSSVGRAAEAVDKKMKAEVDIGSAEKNQTIHKFSFKLMALRALAKIEYQGWVKAALNYDAKASKAEAEVFENLANNKDLIISHSITANESKSQLSLRWNW